MKLIALLRNYVENHRQNVRSAECDLAGIKAQHECWKRSQDEDGMGSWSNPYESKSSSIEARVKQLQQDYTDAKEVLDFTLDHFVILATENLDKPAES